jgi:hypothetical protein
MMDHAYKAKLELVLVILCSFIAVTSLILVIVVLFQLHSKRGIDMVFTGATAICFICYRCCLTFKLYNQELYLNGDSWHKLTNIFMLAEFAAMAIYLGRISEQYKGLLQGLAMTFIILLQEENSFSLKNAVYIIIMNNTILIGANFLLTSDTPTRVNIDMVQRTAFWYVVSIVGFLVTLDKTLDFYLLGDDLFVFSTGMSLFYSW